MEEFLGRHYKLKSSDNFDEYLKCIDNPFYCLVGAAVVYASVKHEVPGSGKVILGFSVKKFSVAARSMEVCPINGNRLTLYYVGPNIPGELWLCKNTSAYSFGDKRREDVGLLSRKTATSVSPVASLVLNDDGTYTLTMTTLIRTVKLTFKLGEEFVEERADGVKVKSILTIEGNVLTQLQTENNGRKSKHVRTFTKDKLTTISTVDGWDGKCVRIYEYAH